MAGGIPKKIPWLDEIKQSGRLALFFDASLAKSGWERAFKDAITQFNDLTSTHRLGVTYSKAEEGRSKAQVEAHAKRGDFTVDYPPDFPYQVPPAETKKFDGTSAHGACIPAITQVQDRSRNLEYRLARAFIYVPASPTEKRNGTPSAVGEPVKLVIAVHELIHACGIVDNDEHSVDDVFCWPSIRMGDRPNEDRLETLGETYTFPGKPGEAPRVGHRKVDMPPIFLKDETAEKVRKLWT
jgi:hypothetical protein